jgi:hypothetical protein
MLTERYPNLQIVAQHDWQPYPPAIEREAWESLPASVLRALIREGESALDYQWIPLLATPFLEYVRIGNRTNYEQQNFERRNKLIALALAECAEGKGRFIDQIVNGIWLICEETYWGLPAHLHYQKSGSGLPDFSEPTVDLFAAETASALAYIQYLLSTELDAISPLIRQRIVAEIDRRILTPNLERDDFGWMGFNSRKPPNNWNPWVNSNWLACVLFIESDVERRLRAIAKIMRSLDRFIDPYPADGGCDEGPGYWMRAAGSLYDCLDLLHQASSGQINVYGESLIQEMARFIYRVQIDNDYYINFADAMAVLQPEASLVYRYGEAIGDADMMAFGAWIDRESQSTGGAWGSPIHSPMRQLRTIFSAEVMQQNPAYVPQPRDVWLPQIQVMAARDAAKSGRGLYVAAKGGHNDESHNHNDIGEFVVYINGQPLLVDAGVEHYTRKTFSPQRYEIWTMQSAYHHLPTIDGFQQSPGAQFKAQNVIYEADEQQATLTLDIAGAYPSEAGIKQWQRTIRLNRGLSVEIVDDYELNHSPQTLTMGLLTPCQVEIASGVIKLTPSELPDGRMAAAGMIHYEAEKFTPSLEVLEITDKRMSRVWGSQLQRILLTAQNPQQRDTWHLEIRQA